MSANLQNHVSVPSASPLSFTPTTTTTTHPIPSDERPSVLERLAAARRSIPPLEARGFNQYYKSFYIEIEDMVLAAKTACDAAGLIFTLSTEKIEKIEGGVRVEIMLALTSVSRTELFDDEHCSSFSGEGTGEAGLKSAYTSALRIALESTFLITSKPSSNPNAQQSRGPASHDNTPVNSASAPAARPSSPAPTGNRMTGVEPLRGKSIPEATLAELGRCRFPSWATRFQDRTFETSDIEHLRSFASKRDASKPDDRIFQDAAFRYIALREESERASATGFDSMPDYNAGEEDDELPF